jgi:hypothetical protein
MVNLNKVSTIEGYSSDELVNPMMSSIMYESVVRELAMYEESGGRVPPGNKTVEATVCDFCGELPCVWLSERDAVLANDRVEHDDSVINSKRRKTAYRHMFRVTNGLGQKGVRVQHPECIETGVRTMFPDVGFMGFKEE